MASCIVQAGEKLVICNALTSGDQPTTRIVLFNHQVTGLGITQLRAQVRALQRNTVQLDLRRFCLALSPGEVHVI